MNDLTPESAARFQRTQELLEQLNTITDSDIATAEGRQRYRQLASELLDVCDEELAYRHERGDDETELAHLRCDSTLLRLTLEVLA